MQCTANVTIGGFLFEGVDVDMTTEDGHQWHFAGYAGAIGPPNVGHGSNFSGDFPGLDHIDGSCWLEIAQAEIGAGGCVLNFHDSHGEIGTLTGVIYGGGFNAGLGGGSWDDEEWKALKNKTGLPEDYADSAK